MVLGLKRKAAYMRGKHYHCTVISAPPCPPPGRVSKLTIDDNNLGLELLLLLLVLRLQDVPPCLALGPCFAF